MSRLPRPLLISTALLATLLPTLAQAAADSERYDCVIEPSARIKVASPVRGIIEEVKVDRGDRVEQGQVIARVKASVEQATVKLLELRAGSNAVVVITSYSIHYTKLYDLDPLPQHRVGTARLTFETLLRQLVVTVAAGTARPTLAIEVIENQRA